MVKIRILLLILEHLCLLLSQSKGSSSFTFVALDERGLAGGLAYVATNWEA